MKQLDFHDLLNGCLITVLSGGIIGLFALNNSVIALTQKIESIREITTIKIDSLDKRVTLIEKMP